MSTITVEFKNRLLRGDAFREGNIVMDEAGHTQAYYDTLKLEADTGDVTFMFNGFSVAVCKGIVRGQLKGDITLHLPLVAPLPFQLT